jgi:hypothetical protein
VESRSHDIEVKSHDTKVVSHDTTIPRLEGATDAEVNGFTLPSFETSHDEKVMPRPRSDAADDSDSSSWSSSDEEEEKGKGAIKPSTHSTLIAEWEWRAMKQDTPTSRYVKHHTNFQRPSMPGKLFGRWLLC